MNEFHGAFNRRLFIGGLRSKSVGGHSQNSFAADPSSQVSRESGLLFLCKQVRCGDRNADSDLSRHFVNVLPAGSRTSGVFKPNLRTLHQSIIQFEKFHCNLLAPLMFWIDSLLRTWTSAKQQSVFGFQLDCGQDDTYCLYAVQSRHDALFIRLFFGMADDNMK